MTLAIVGQLALSVAGMASEPESDRADTVRLVNESIRDLARGLTITNINALRELPRKFVIPALVESVRDDLDMWAPGTRREAISILSDIRGAETSEGFDLLVASLADSGYEQHAIRGLWFSAPEYYDRLSVVLGPYLDRWLERYHADTTSSYQYLLYQLMKNVGKMELVASAWAPRLNQILQDHDENRQMRGPAANALICVLGVRDFAATVADLPPHDTSCRLGSMNAFTRYAYRHRFEFLHKADLREATIDMLKEQVTSSDSGLARIAIIWGTSNVTTAAMFRASGFEVVSEKWSEFLETVAANHPSPEARIAAKDGIADMAEILNSAEH